MPAKLFFYYTLIVTSVYHQKEDLYLPLHFLLIVS